MEQPFRDALARFVFEPRAVRGALVSLDATRADILACHAYPPALARVLTELLAAAALVASSLKFQGSLIVQLQAEGPVRLLVVECDAELNLRATAQWTDAAAALPVDADLATLVGGAGNGRLAIILDPKDGGQIYQGIVTLEATGIAALMEHYFATSEQIPSRIAIAADATRVRGLLLQRLPGGTAEDDALWAEVAAQVDHVAPAHLLDAADPAQLLTRHFAGEDIRLFRAYATHFRCSCTQERVENALRLVGAREIDEILAEHGEVSVTCEFCNCAYAFAPESARALFRAGEADPARPVAARH
ncbi:MAG: Hsp33 family molecular chaperone HslO [Casimicrobiaceae bacterium]